MGVNSGANQDLFGPDIFDVPVPSKTVRTCFCGRSGGPVRTKRVRGVDWMGPFCVGQCPSFTAEELADRAFLRSLLVVKPQWLDEGVGDLVVACRDAGLLTMSSCSGHGRMPGYIIFFERADRDTALYDLFPRVAAPNTLFREGTRRMGRLWGEDPFPTVQFMLENPPPPRVRSPAPRRRPV